MLRKLLRVEKLRCESHSSEERISEGNKKQKKSSAHVTCGVWRVTCGVWHVACGV
jgi:uncharacterized cupin superfamily protein